MNILHVRIMYIYKTNIEIRKCMCFRVFVDYLQYTDCYRVINKDWDACANTFMSLVREKMNGNQSEEVKLLDLCW